MPFNTPRGRNDARNEIAEKRRTDATVKNNAYNGSKQDFKPTKKDNFAGKIMEPEKPYRRPETTSARGRYP